MAIGNNIVIERSGEGSSAPDDLSIKIPRRNFGEFIKGLLGQPYEISRKIKARFDIDHGFVIQIVNLLNQRIQSQSDADMIQFTGYVGFDDGVETKISTFDAFESYINTQNKLSCKIGFTLTYLIQFPGRSVPEKQQIFFNAIGFTSSKRNALAHSYTLGDSVIIHDEFSMDYRVESTERTWAEDIEKILNESLSSAVIPTSRAERFLEGVRGYVIAGIVCSAVAVPAVVEYLRINISRDQIALAFSAENFRGDQIIDAMKFLINAYLQNSINMVIIMCYIMYCVITFAFCLYLSDFGKDDRSFVVVGDASRARCAEYRGSKKREPSRFLRDFTIGCFSSIVVSILFLKYGYIFT